jgi:hypothetical protein
MRLWGAVLLCPLAACVPDVSAQPLSPRSGRPLPPAAFGVGGLQPRRAGGAVVVARRVDAGAPGSLPRAVLREAIRGRMGDVQRCYQQGLAIDRNLAGRVTVAFVLDAQGAVTETAVTEDGLDRPQVAQCIADVARRWTFPAPGGVMRFEYPFHLRAD